MYGYCWGENVTTLNTGTYSGIIGGTYSAAALVTGCVISIQSMCVNHYGYILNPIEVIDIISNTGDDPINPGQSIGKKPNLKAFIEEYIGNE